MMNNQLMKNNEWIVHHNNTLQRTALTVKQFLVDSSVETPTLFAGLGTVRVFLFPKVKSILKGDHFQTVEKVKQKTAALFKASPEEFHNCFQQWKLSMQTCVDREGEYIEVDYL